MANTFTYDVDTKIITLSNSLVDNVQLTIDELLEGEQTTVTDNRIIWSISQFILSCNLKYNNRTELHDLIVEIIRTKYSL